MKIVIFGGTGFIGSALTASLKQKGFEVVVFARHPSGEAHYWNPETNRLDLSLIEGCDVVINLSGESIFGLRSTAKRARIEKSRLLSAEFLTTSIFSLRTPPALYIGASAIGYYGDRGQEKLTEASSPGHSFLANLCTRLERIPEKLKEKEIRVVHMRLGVVFGKGGGAYARMATPFKWGLGAIFGSGDQMVSWIALNDLLLAIAFIIQNKELSGALNLTSPYPVTNREMTKALAKVLSRPVFLTLPRWLLSWLLGVSAEALLDSTAAFPQVLTDAGFIFQFPKIEGALKNSALGR